MESIIDSIEFSFVGKDNQEYIIRQAKIEDAKNTASVKRQVLDEGIYLKAQKNERTFDKQSEEELIEVCLTDENKLYLVCELNNKVVGVLEFINGRYKKNKHSGKLMLYIAVDHREKGVGTQILRTLLEWAHKNSTIEKVLLEVFSDNNRGIYLFKRLGFKDQGTSPKSLKLEDGTYLDSVFMYRIVAPSQPEF